MRTVIAIESSTPNGSIAVWKDGAIVLEEVFVSQRSHNTAIYEPLGRALDCAAEVDVIVLGTGPGSYTGVRIGIAAATGIALARGMEVVGLPSGYGMVVPSALEGGVTLTGDARRGGTWVMDLDNDLRWEPPQVIPTEDIADFLAPRASRSLIDSDATSPCASRLAAFVGQLTAAAYETLRQHPVLPIYVRPPFITKPKEGHPLER